MSLARVVKKFEFLRPRLKGKASFWYLIFIRKASFLIFAKTEHFMFITCVVKKLEFWQSSLGGFSILLPQILSNFIFPLYLHTLNNSCAQFKK